jgi:hypothetical protein
MKKDEHMLVFLLVGEKGFEQAGSSSADSLDYWEINKNNEAQVASAACKAQARAWRFHPCP